jgi:hypothetical protein
MQTVKTIRSIKLWQLLPPGKTQLLILLRRSTFIKLPTTKDELLGKLCRNKPRKMKV